MRNRTITKEGIEKLMAIKELMIRSVNQMENLKIIDFGSDWAIISFALYPCYKEIKKFLDFIDHYLSGDNSK